MSISTASLSPPTFSPSSYPKCPLLHKPYFFLRPNKPPLLLLSSSLKASADNGAKLLGPAATPTETVAEPAEEKDESSGGTAGSSAAAAGEVKVKVLSKFEDPKWVGGTWDLKQFTENGKINRDAVIDAAIARRRKWLEDNPESSSNDNPIHFDTSIIPWWAWMKSFHLPEAELLNGRAAMIGFFTAYLVDSLTGLGLVDQMSNFFCETLMLVAVVGVLLIRKNEDIENLKKLLGETTFYDKQWQATWHDDTSSET